jgi:hypothetical protein
MIALVTLMTDDGTIISQTNFRCHNGNDAVGASFSPPIVYKDYVIRGYGLKLEGEIRKCSA